MSARVGLSTLAFTAAVLAWAAGVAGAGDAYQYDSTGRLSRVVYASGRTVDYAYDGNSNVTAIISSIATGVEPSPEAPRFVNALRAARPNPVSGEARLAFSLAREARATLRLFDVSGRLVRTIFDRDFPAGEYEARVSLSDLPTGIYFYRLEGPRFKATQRLVLLK